MIQVEMTSSDGVILLTEGKTCTDNILVVPTFLEEDADEMTVFTNQVEKRIEELGIMLPFCSKHYTGEIVRDATILMRQPETMTLYDVSYSGIDCSSKEAFKTSMEGYSSIYDSTYSLTFDSNSLDAINLSIADWNKAEQRKALVDQVAKSCAAKIESSIAGEYENCNNYKTVDSFSAPEELWSIFEDLVKEFRERLVSAGKKMPAGKKLLAFLHPAIADQILKLFSLTYNPEYSKNPGYCGDYMGISFFNNPYICDSEEVDTRYYKNIICTIDAFFEAHKLMYFHVDDAQERLCGLMINKAVVNDARQDCITVWNVGMEMA